MIWRMLIPALALGAAVVPTTARAQWAVKEEETGQQMMQNVTI